MRPRQIAGVTSALLIAALVTACGSKTPGSDAKSGAPTKDTLTVANAIDVASFDPQKLQGIDSQVAVANMYDRLVYLDADNTVKPWLAEKWETSADGLTWTFHMRKDAKFHDGSAVTAEAVKFSIERSLNGGPSVSLNYLSAISKVEASDPYTVQITTKEPFAPLLRNLGHQLAAAVLNPKAVQEKNNDLSKPVDVGSGMYKLVSWTPKQEMVLERNEDWWGPKPAFKKVIYKPVTDPATRSIMLEKGDVDVATVLPLQGVERLQQNTDLKLTDSKSIRVTFFHIAQTKAPFNDVRVRQALNYAVDVDSIIKSVLYGKGQRLRSIISPSLEFSSPAYQISYDPVKAKQLLSEAGVKPGTKIAISGPQGRWAGDSEIVQAVAGYLKEVGLDPQVKVVGDFSQYLAQGKNTDWDLYMDSWAPGNLDPDAMVYGVVSSKGSDNFGKYSSADADKAVLGGRAAIDPKQRGEQYGKLQEVIGKDVPYLLLQTSASFSGTRSNICGVQVRGDDANLIKLAKPCQ